MEILFEEKKKKLWKKIEEEIKKKKKNCLKSFKSILKKQKGWVVVLSKEKKNVFKKMF